MRTILANVSCVAVAGRAILIEGVPGSGKSSLALALIDRGAILVGDDGVTLESRGSRLWALPPPNISGLIEVRNVGLVTLPTGSATVAIVIQLDTAAPRYVGTAEAVHRAGHAIPAIALHPDIPILALRAEYALKSYGLG